MPFEPEDISNAIEVWVADDIAQSNGTAVTNWTGRVAGKILTQADSGARPTYLTSGIGSQPTVDFDTDDYLRLAESFPATSTAGSVYVLMKHQNHGGIVWSSSDEASTTRSLWGWTWYTFPDAGSLARISQENADAESWVAANDSSSPYTYININSDYLIRWGSSGATYFLRVDEGVQAIGGVNNDGDWFTETTARDNFVLGGKFTSGGFTGGFGGQIAAVFIVDGSISSTDQNSMHNWMNEKYGLDLSYTPPSPNDNFADAIDLGSSASGEDTSSDTIAATVEIDEPLASEAFDDENHHTVWWKWTAPSDMTITFDTFGSEDLVDTLLAIYTGTALDNLVEVTSSEDFGGIYDFTTSGVEFEADSGVTYYIQVGTYSEEEYGEYILTWGRDTSPPPNDDFADAIDLGTTEYGQVSETTFLATVEVDEPEASASQVNGSLWYTWTAPDDGTVTFDTLGSSDEFDTALAVWTGTALNNLVEIASNDDGPDATGNQSQVEFEADNGQEYYIQVGSYYDDEFGTVVLTWVFGDPATNDDFADATDLGSALGTFESVSYGATIEVGEPIPERTTLTEIFHSIWFKWVPPGPGYYIIDTLGSEVEDTLLGLNSSFDETPDDVTDQFEVTSNDNISNSERRSLVTVNEESMWYAFYIQVSGASISDHGPITLNIAAAESDSLGPGLGGYLGIDGVLLGVFEDSLYFGDDENVYRFLLVDLGPATEPEPFETLPYATDPYDFPFSYLGQQVMDKRGHIWQWRWDDDLDTYALERWERVDDEYALVESDIETVDDTYFLGQSYDECTDALYIVNFDVDEPDFTWLPLRKYQLPDGPLTDFSDEDIELGSYVFDQNVETFNDTDYVAPVHTPDGAVWIPWSDAVGGDGGWYRVDSEGETKRWTLAPDHVPFFQMAFPYDDTKLLVISTVTGNAYIIDPDSDTEEILYPEQAISEEVLSFAEDMKEASATNARVVYGGGYAWTDLTDGEGLWRAAYVCEEDDDDEEEEPWEPGDPEPLIIPGIFVLAARTDNIIKKIRTLEKH